MQYQVFVENPAERRFVASVLGMPAVSEEGTTEEEAVSKAKAALEAQLAKGKIINIKIQATTVRVVEFTRETDPTNSPYSSTFPKATTARVVEFTRETDPTNSPYSSTFPIQYAGIFADDSSFEDWTEKLALIRREENAEADE